MRPQTVDSPLGPTAWKPPGEFRIHPKRFIIRPFSQNATDALRTSAPLDVRP
jgi:hypothetical protein